MIFLKKYFLTFLIIFPVNLYSFWTPTESKKAEIQFEIQADTKKPLSIEEEKINKIKKIILNAYLDCLEKNTQLQQNRDEKIAKVIAEKDFWYENIFNAESNSNIIILFEKAFAHLINLQTKKDALDCNKYLNDYNRIPGIEFQLKIEKSKKSFNSEK